MTSEIDILMADDLDLAFSDGGDAATYTPEGGEPTTVTVLLGAIESRRVMQGMQEADVLGRDITVRISEVADPQIGGVFTVGGEDWGVDAMLTKTAVVATLACVQIDRRSIGDANRNAEIPE